MSKNLLCVLVLVFACALLVDGQQSDRKDKEPIGERTYLESNFANAAQLIKNLTALQRNLANTAQIFERLLPRLDIHSLKDSQSNVNVFQPVETFKKACPAHIGDHSRCREIGGVGCYCFFHVPMTWKDADALCRSKGMKLVSIDSDREQRSLVTSSTSLDYKDWWTSGVKVGNWQWASTGQKMNYTNWGKDQPRKGRNTNFAVKLIMSSWRYVWEVVPRSTKCSPLCEN